MLDGLVVGGGEVGVDAVARLRLGGRLRQAGEPVAPAENRTAVHRRHQIARGQTRGALQRRVLHTRTDRAAHHQTTGDIGGDK